MKSSPFGFENGAFELRWHQENRLIFLTEFSTNTNPTSPTIFTFLNSCSVVWTKNIGCNFKVKTPFSHSSAQLGRGFNNVTKSHAYYQSVKEMSYLHVLAEKNPISCLNEVKDQKTRTWQHHGEEMSTATNNGTYNILENTRKTCVTIR